MQLPSLGSFRDNANLGEESQTPPAAGANITPHQLGSSKRTQFLSKSRLGKTDSTLSLRSAMRKNKRIRAQLQMEEKFERDASQEIMNESRWKSSSLQSPEGSEQKQNWRDSASRRSNTQSSRTTHSFNRRNKRKNNPHHTTALSSNPSTRNPTTRAKTSHNQQASKTAGPIQLASLNTAPRLHQEHLSHANFVQTSNTRPPKRKLPSSSIGSVNPHAPTFKHTTSSPLVGQNSSSSQLLAPNESIMDRFHNEFITSLNTLQKPDPLGNTSILFYEEKMEERMHEQRLHQQEVKRRQRETRKRLKKYRDKEEKKWKKWLKDTVRAASPKKQHSTHRGSRQNRLGAAKASYIVAHDIGDYQMQQFSRLQTAPASQRHPGHGASRDFPVASDMIPHSVRSGMSSCRDAQLTNTEKTYAQLRRKHSKPVSQRERALDSWYSSLMENISDKYAAPPVGTPQQQSEEEYDWRKHRETDLHSKSFHFDSTERGAVTWNNSDLNLTSW